MTTVQQQDSLFNSSNQILQVHRVDQTLLPAQVDSFVGCSFHCALHPPALFRNGEDRRKKKREVLHLFRCYTHTRTHARTHARLCHTQLCHAPSFTHNLSHDNFVPHHLSHTTLSHTHTHNLSHNFVTHTQLCHTPSFTHNFVTHHLSHTTLPHTLAQKYLIELLMWSASGVHKQSPKV